MTDVNTELADIVALGQRAADVQSEEGAIRDQAHERMRLLCERIVRGEATTGDWIRDFLIVRYGSSLNETIEAIYRDLGARVSTHVGEFMLLVTKDERFHGCTGFGYEPRSSDYNVDEQIRLGVIAAPAIGLDLKAQACAFPVKEHVCCLGVYQPYMSLEQGAIVSADILRDLGRNLDQPLVCQNGLSMHEQPPHLELEVKIGDAEVLAWFEARGDSYLVALREMAKLLHREVPQSEAMEKLLQAKRDALARRLIGLVAKRQELTQDIEDIQRQARRDGRESRSDLWRQEERTLRDVQEQIKKELAVALDLGMADLVLLSIQSLCEEYQVALPES